MRTNRTNPEEDLKMIKRIARGIRNRCIRILNLVVSIRLQTLIKRLHGDPDFPSSAGTSFQHLEQLILGSKQSLNLLIEATSALEKIDSNRIQKLNDIYPVNRESRKLNYLFDIHGSDKGSFHNYTSLYSSLIEVINKPDIRILEVGLGTNNTDTLSNMGAHGKPGASLRAWRDYCPNAEVVGCDIDARVLFSEERISTFQLDQLSPASWNKLKAEVTREGFDLIIDDGLHSPLANLQTILQSHEMLRENGYLIIEDISIQSLPIWKIFSMLLNKNWRIELVESSHAFVGVINRRD